MMNWRRRWIGITLKTFILARSVSSPHFYEHSRTPERNYDATDRSSAPFNLYPSLVNWLVYCEVVRKVMSEMNGNTLSMADPETDKRNRNWTGSWWNHLPELTQDCSCSTSWRFFGFRDGGTPIFSGNFAELKSCCNWRNSTFLELFHARLE